MINNLTNREKEVYKLLIKGYVFNEISQKLFISKTTAKTHADVIFQKFLCFGENRRAKLIAQYYEQKIIDLKLLLQGIDEKDVSLKLIIKILEILEKIEKGE